MPYYLRLFSSAEKRITFDQFCECLPKGFSAKIEKGRPEEWEEVLVLKPNGEGACTFEVADQDLLADEIAEFIDQLQALEPRNAAEWASDYLRSTKTLIACQNFYMGVLKSHSEVRHPKFFGGKATVGNRNHAGR